MEILGYGDRLSGKIGHHPGGLVPGLAGHLMDPVRLLLETDGGPINSLCPRGYRCAWLTPRQFSVITQKMPDDLVQGAVRFMTRPSRP